MLRIDASVLCPDWALELPTDPLVAAGFGIAVGLVVGIVVARLASRSERSSHAPSEPPARIEPPPVPLPEPGGFDPRDLTVAIANLREATEELGGADSGFTFGFGFWLAGALVSLLVWFLLFFLGFGTLLPS